MLNSHEPDECCGKHISKWLLIGSPFVIEHAASWICPECGVEWKPQVIEFVHLTPVVRHWQPHPVFAVVPVR